LGKELKFDRSTGSFGNEGGDLFQMDMAGLGGRFQMSDPGCEFGCGGHGQGCCQTGRPDQNR